MSDSPTPPSFSPTKPTTSRPPTPSPSIYSFPRPLSPSKSDALKPNPHPYPIKTTSTGVLSRSNSSPFASTSSVVYQYQYYVPQSPTKEVGTGNGGGGGGGGGANDNGGDMGKRKGQGGRHGYSKSMNLEMMPKPLPVPPEMGTDTRLHSRSARPRLSSRSLSNLGGGMDDVDGQVDVFGDVVMLTGSGRRARADTMPSSTASAYALSIATSAESDDEGRGRHHTLTGSRSSSCAGGGRVKGMVASYERSASLSGDEDTDGYRHSRNEYHRGASRGYAHRRRFRSDSASSSASSTSSTFYTPYRGAEELALSETENRHKHSRLPADDPSNSFDSTPKRHQDQDQDSESLSTEPIVGYHGTETVKFPRTEPPTIIATGFSPNAASSPPHPRDGPNNVFNPDDELTVEELLASLPSSNPSGAGAGADAWEKDVGCTVKRVDEVSNVDNIDDNARGVVDRVEFGMGEESGIVRGKSGRVKSRRGGKDEVKRRLEDMFGVVEAQAGGGKGSVDDAANGGVHEESEQSAPEREAPLQVEEAAKTVLAVDAPTKVVPATQSELLPNSTTTSTSTSSSVLSDREEKLQQEMAETREMVRALSTRVAGVEARIGDMEKVAGELEVRGRRLVMVGTEGREVPQKVVVGEDGGAGGRGEELKGKGKVERSEVGVGVRVGMEAGWDGRESDDDPRTLAKRLAVSLTRSIFGFLGEPTRQPRPEYQSQSSSPSQTSTTPVSMQNPCARLFNLFGLRLHLVGSNQSQSPAQSPTHSQNQNQNRNWSKWRENPGLRALAASWSSYLLVLGLGACAFVLRAVVRRAVRSVAWGRR
ncbi:hypothetical protein AX17_002773 [Amanita inopinata Kibby_2008]|nr:hypothetical protein AX17_002773 [Amanita inopinata Kibby_2008]